LTANLFRRPVDRHLEAVLGEGGDAGEEVIVIAHPFEEGIRRAAVAGGLAA
jgi:hypothetical protein